MALEQLVFPVIYYALALARLHLAFMMQLAVAFTELVLLPGCGLYRAGAVAWMWPLQSWCCCLAVAFIELVLLPGCDLYRAGAVAWLWPL